MIVDISLEEVARHINWYTDPSHHSAPIFLGRVQKSLSVCSAGAVLEAGLGVLGVDAAG
jgi:hypothetical protein